MQAPECGHLSGADINAGHCLDLAECVLADVPGATWEDYTAYGEDTLPCHHWVSWGGRHYDAETPGGVADWADLPIMVRWRAEQAEHAPAARPVRAVRKGAGTARTEHGR